ncbi:hypothetical protein GQ457_01G055510 [Hibiscus cannabinus]
MARFEEGRSISCPPLFEGEAYFQWSNVMKYFILAQDIKVWVVIENGYMEAPKKKKKQRSENDTKAKLNSRAMHMLLCGLNEEVSKNVSTCKSAKEIWEKLEKLYGKEEKKDGVPSCANLIQSSKVDDVLAFNEPESKPERFSSFSTKSMAEATKRHAVVTGANKGIGLEICKQLASKGIMVVLTARDEERGLEAVRKLKELGLSDNVVFHHLDIADPANIASLVEFIETQFGKLDILVNNAGIRGYTSDGEAFRAAGIGKPGVQVNLSGLLTQTLELSEQCLQTNYYGTKRMCESLLHLLQRSDSPRIVNVSSSLGKLKDLPNEWAKGVFSDAENLTEEKVDEVLSRYVEDLKEGSLEEKSWPAFFSAYILSKAALNAYTRILAKKYPDLIINCVCPGYVKTDLNYNSGILSVEEGAEGPVRLALLPNGGPSGLFFERNQESEF